MLHYKALLFDLGNVIIDIHFDRCLKVWSDCSGMSVEELTAFFGEDAFYQKHERGEITGRQYHQSIVGRLQISLSYGDFVRGWNSVLGDPIAVTLNFLKKHHGRLPFYLLTNSNVLHRDLWTVKYAETLSLMDTVFCSSQIGTRKPEPAAYETVLQKTGLVPADLFFIDDKAENIAGAETCGIQGLKFSDPGRDISLLEQMVFGESL